MHRFILKAVTPIHRVPFISAQYTEEFHSFKHFFAAGVQVISEYREMLEHSDVAYCNVPRAYAGNQNLLVGQAFPYLPDTIFNFAHPSKRCA